MDTIKYTIKNVFFSSKNLIGQMVLGSYPPRNSENFFQFHLFQLVDLIPHLISEMLQTFVNCAITGNFKKFRAINWQLQKFGNESKLPPQFEIRYLYL